LKKANAFKTTLKKKDSTQNIPYLSGMNKIRITKQFDFETGHALYGYDGKCRNVHGHSYKLSVTVIGTPIEDKNNVKYGMVIDFKDLKKIVKEQIVDAFDHATVFNKNTPHLELAHELQSRGHSVILVDYQPTSEMMLVDFAAKIKGKLPVEIKLHSLRLQETATSYAEWFSDENS
jgi:6-pyruvoyltetrahydropterin/6-carboxytetrahydropterin synthase